MAQYTESKSYCEDLTEGKFSYPIIHAITNFPEDKTIISKSLKKPNNIKSITNIFSFFTAILRLKTSDIEVKKFAVAYLEKLGSLQATSNKLVQLRNEIDKEIERLGGNPQLNSIMELLYLDQSKSKNLKKDSAKASSQ